MNQVNTPDGYVAVAETTSGKQTLGVCNITDKAGASIELTKEQTDCLESDAEKQNKETSGMCPLMGPTGKLCNTGCAWYIKGRGCSVAIIARDISGR